MNSEQSIFKLFLTIELPKQLTAKDSPQYRFTADIQDQSKSFSSSSTSNILFFLNEIENSTNLTIKIVSEKIHKIVGSLTIPIPFAINFEPEITVNSSFTFDNVNAKYTIYILNVPMFQQSNTSQVKQTSTNVSKISKSPQPTKQYFSKDSYMQQINKEVNSILKKHNNSLSSRKEKTLDTGIVDESPSRISDRVQVSRTGTIVQSEISPQLRQYVLEESPSKISTSKEREINHRHHQDLSCLYYLDQATLTNQIQIENENLKEIIVNLNNKIEFKDQEIIIYRSLEQNYKELQNQLTTLIKNQELTKSAEQSFDTELVKINEKLNARIQSLVDNEKRLNKQKLDQEVQISQLKNEITMLRENLYELSEKQKIFLNLQSDLLASKKLSEDLKQQLLKKGKDFDGKIQTFEKNLDMTTQQYNEKIKQLTDNLYDHKKANEDLEKQNKSLSFQLKKAQENKSVVHKPLTPSNTPLLEPEDTSKQVEVLKEINNQQLQEINQLKNYHKKLEKSGQELQNELSQVKNSCTSLKQELLKLKETNQQIQNQKNKLTTELKSIQQQLELEKSKNNSLQSQLKAKNIQLQEALQREETHETQIQKLELITKQMKKLLENQEEQIILLNNQVKELQEQKQKQLKENKEDQQKMSQLKSLISGMKEAKIAYIPMHGDPIDQALSEFINSVDDPKKIIELFFREREGQYVIGGKNVHLKTEQGKVYVKVGGGFIGIEEYLDVYLKDKIDKLEKKTNSQTPRSKTPSKGQRSLTQTSQFV